MLCQTSIQLTLYVPSTACFNFRTCSAARSQQTYLLDSVAFLHLLWPLLHYVPYDHEAQANQKAHVHCTDSNTNFSALQFASDTQAYGVASASPCLARTASVFSQSESVTSESSSGGSDVSSQYCCRLSHRQPKKVKAEQPKKRLHGLIMPVLTAGAAVVVGCKGRSMS